MKASVRTKKKWFCEPNIWDLISGTLTVKASMLDTYSCMAEEELCILLFMQYLLT